MSSKQAEVERRAEPAPGVPVVVLTQFLAALRAKGMSPLLIGVAFACQEVDAVPMDAHDVPLDLIATEAEIITR